MMMKMLVVVSYVKFAFAFLDDPTTKDDETNAMDFRVLSLLVVAMEKVMHFFPVDLSKTKKEISTEVADFETCYLTHTIIRCDDGCENCTFGLVLLNAELVFGAFDGTEDGGIEVGVRLPSATDGVTIGAEMTNFVQQIDFILVLILLKKNMNDLHQITWYCW